MQFSNRCALILALLLSLGTQALAQRSCGSLDKLDRLLIENPGLRDDMDAIESLTQAAMLAPPLEGSVIYNIPVVVHIVYNNAAQNVSNAQVQTQITVLNEDFRLLNPNATSIQSMFQGVAADSEIEFCLATLDPNGNATSGITRRQTTVSSFSTNDFVMATATGGQDPWPTSDYLNIWVCPLNGFLGYAQFPGGPASTDGIVVDTQAFGRGGSAQVPFHLGRTATHEVGHWLNLRHIWGDGGCSQDDLVADTPSSNAPNYGCALGHVSCGTVDMVQNYMDYSDDACMSLFSSGQKARMRALFSPGGFRASLLNSLGCGTPTGGTAPTANFIANTTSGTAPLTVNFTAQTTGIVSTHQWDFGDGATSTQIDPSHTYTAAGSYTVTLTATGPGGSHTESKAGFITVNQPGVASTFPDGSFENQTAATSPQAPWMTQGTGHVILPDGVSSDGGLPSDGTKWCEISASSTDGATPPSNPGGLTSPSSGGAGVLQSFNYDPSHPLLSLTAAFLRNENANDPTYNDWMSVDISDGGVTRNLFYRDTFSATPLTSSKHNLPMTTPEVVTADLSVLFPSATTSTVFSLTILIGNGTDAIADSLGYVDEVKLDSNGGPMPSNETGHLYVTFENNTTVPGLGTVQACDVVRYDFTAGVWEMYLDGSDVGLSNVNIDALHVFTTGEVIFSLTGPNLQVPGLIAGPSGTTVSGSDIIAFIPGTTGANTSGLLYFVLDGSDISLTTADEDIDGLFSLPNGIMLLSTFGAASLPNLGNIAPADLIVFFPTSLGAFTGGTTLFAFDGSDLGLTTVAENIDAVGFTAEATLLFSTTGAFSASGASGANEDVAEFSGLFGTGSSGTIQLRTMLTSLGINSSANVNGLTRIP